jgi:hypothetical protein
MQIRLSNQHPSHFESAHYSQLFQVKNARGEQVPPVAFQKRILPGKNLRCGVF